MQVLGPFAAAEVDFGSAFPGIDRGAVKDDMDHRLGARLDFQERLKNVVFQTMLAMVCLKINVTDWKLISCHSISVGNGLNPGLHPVLPRCQTAPWASISFKSYAKTSPDANVVGF